MARLLATTDLSIAVAARAVGWSDPSYASPCFHAHYDPTPTEYRRQQCGTPADGQRPRPYGLTPRGRVPNSSRN
jgi:AraC-like DNA-binding protein